MNGKTFLENVTCARLPTSSLASLAGLRRVPGISVLLDGEDSWVFWEPGDDEVLRAVLPAVGVELFERRGDAWHRPGQLLPCFGMPPRGEPIPLDRAVIPAPFEVEMLKGHAASPSPLRLARDERPRPTTAALCPTSELARWAEWAPSSEIETIRGSIQGEMALLLGRNLPPWTGSARFWGRRILVPIGHEPRPNLPEEILLETLGSSGDEIFRLIPDGDEGERIVVEAIPLDSFRILSRASIRLALGARIA